MNSVEIGYYIIDLAKLLTENETLAKVLKDWSEQYGYIKPVKNFREVFDIGYSCHCEFGENEFEKLLYTCLKELHKVMSSDSDKSLTPKTISRDSFIKFLHETTKKDNGIKETMKEKIKSEIPSDNFIKIKGGALYAYMAVTYIESIKDKTECGPEVIDFINCFTKGDFDFDLKCHMSEGDMSEGEGYMSEGGGVMREENLFFMLFRLRHYVIPPTDRFPKELILALSNKSDGDFAKTFEKIFKSVKRCMSIEYETQEEKKLNDAIKNKSYAKIANSKQFSFPNTLKFILDSIFNYHNFKDLEYIKLWHGRNYHTEHIEDCLSDLESVEDAIVCLLYILLQLQERDCVKRGTSEVSELITNYIYEYFVDNSGNESFVDNSGNESIVDNSGNESIVVPLYKKFKALGILDKFKEMHKFVKVNLYLQNQLNDKIKTYMEDKNSDVEKLCKYLCGAQRGKSDLAEKFDSLRNHIYKSMVKLYEEISLHEILPTKEDGKIKGRNESTSFTDGKSFIGKKDILGSDKVKEIEKTTTDNLKTWNIFLSSLVLKSKEESYKCKENSDEYAEFEQVELEEKKEELLEEKAKELLDDNGILRFYIKTEEVETEEAAAEEAAAEEAAAEEAAAEEAAAEEAAAKEAEEL